MQPVRKHPDDDTMKAAIKAVQRGWSYAKAAKHYCIPKTTIHDHLHNKNNILDRSSSKKIVPNKLLSQNEEVSVVNYVKWMASQALPVTRKVLKIVVQEILLQKKIKFNPKKTPSKKWCQRFLKQHQLKSKKARQTEPDRIVTEVQVKTFFDKLRTKIDQFDPKCIFNVDETGFSRQTKIQAPVIAPVGCRAITKKIFTNDHITSVNCISADGQNMPPMVIFSKRVPRELQEKEISGWLYKSTPSGFINSDLFCEWFDQIFLKNKPQNSPSLLIMDAHSTHVTHKVVETAKINQVELVTIPAKSSHLLQPLDQIFHSMKENFAELAISLKYVNSDVLTNTSKLPYILRIAMEKAWSTYVIKMAFQRTGTCTYIHIITVYLSYVIAYEMFMVNMFYK